MSKGKKIALGIGIGLVVILLALLILVPMLVDLDRYRPRVVAYLQAETGKPAEIGSLSLSLFPAVSIRADDFALGNPPGFPKGYFLKARRIYVEVDARALWDRRVVVKSLQIDEPAIHLLSNTDGKWNFESPPRPKAIRQAAAPEKPLFTLGTISNIKVSGAHLTAANLLPSARPGPTYFEARGLSSELEQVDLNAFIAQASASPPPARPPGFVEVFAGLRATVLYAQAPGAAPAAQGTLDADSLRFGSLEATSVQSKLRLFPKQVFFDDLRFHLYDGRATGSLAFNFAGRNPRYSTAARLSGVDVAKLLAAFPEGRGKMSGSMEGNIKLNGEVTHSPDPLAGMRGAGQMSIRNGQLPSLQLNKNLMLLARLTNLRPASGDPSSFSLVSADLNIANNKITSEKVTIVGHGVEVDGKGSLALGGDGNLDYEGLAKVLAGPNPLTGVLANLSGATFADGKLTFPFNLAGTFASPQFKMKSAAGGGRLGLIQSLAGGTGPQGANTPETGAQPGQTQPQQQQQRELIQGLSGLFKKKSSQQSQPTTQPTTQQPKP